MPIKRALGKNVSIASVPVQKKTFGDLIATTDLNKKKPVPSQSFDSSRVPRINGAGFRPEIAGLNLELSGLLDLPLPAYESDDTVEGVPTNVVALIDFNRAYEESSKAKLTQFGAQFQALLTSHNLNVKDVSYIVSEAANKNASSSLKDARDIINSDISIGNYIPLLSKIFEEMSKAEDSLDISRSFFSEIQTAYDATKQSYEPSAKDRSFSFTAASVLLPKDNITSEEAQEVSNLNNLQLTRELLAYIDDFIDGELDPSTGQIIASLKEAMNGDISDSDSLLFSSNLKDATDKTVGSIRKNRIIACVLALSRIFTFSSPEQAGRSRARDTVLRFRKNPSSSLIKIDSARSQIDTFVSYTDTSAAPTEQQITPVEPVNQKDPTGNITQSGPNGLIRNPIVRGDFSCQPYSNYAAGVERSFQSIEEYTVRKLRLFTDATSPIRIFQIILLRFIEALEEALQDESDRVQLVALQEGNRLNKSGGKIPTLSDNEKHKVKDLLTVIACSVQKERNNSNASADSIKTSEIVNSLDFEVEIKKTNSGAKDVGGGSEYSFSAEFNSTVTVNVKNEILKNSSKEISKLIWKARGYKSGTTAVGSTNETPVHEYINDAIQTSVNNKGRTVIGKIASAYRDMYETARDAYGDDTFKMTTTAGLTKEGKLDETAVMSLITECFSLLAADLKLGLTETEELEEEDFTATAVGTAVGSVVGGIIGGVIGASVGAYAGVSLGSAAGAGVGRIIDDSQNEEVDKSNQKTQNGLRKISSRKDSIEKFDVILPYNELLKFQTSNDIENDIRQVQIALIDYLITPKDALTILEGFSLGLNSAHQRLVSEISSIMSTNAARRIREQPTVIAGLSLQQVALRRALQARFAPTSFESGMLPSRLAPKSGEIISLRVLLNDPKFSSKGSENTRLMCVGMPIGTDDHRKFGKFEHDLSKTASYNLNVHFKDLEFDDLLFVPKTFKFDPALFVVPESFSRVDESVTDLNTLLGRVDFYLANQGKTSLDSPTFLNLSQLKISRRYKNGIFGGGIDDSDIEDIARNTLISYLFETYVFMNTGLLLDETAGFASAPTISARGSRILREVSAANVSTLQIPGDFSSFTLIPEVGDASSAMMEASDGPSRANRELLGALSRSYLFRSDSLSDIMLSPLAFDRCFIVPVDPDDFQIDVSQTNKTTMGEFLLKDIRDNRWTNSSGNQIRPRNPNTGGFIAGQLSAQFINESMSTTTQNNQPVEELGLDGARATNTRKPSVEKLDKNGKRPPFSALKFGRKLSMKGKFLSKSGNRVVGNKFSTKFKSDKLDGASTKSFSKKTIPSLRDAGKDEKNENGTDSITIQPARRAASSTRTVRLKK